MIVFSYIYLFEKTFSVGEGDGFARGMPFCGLSLAFFGYNFFFSEKHKILQKFCGVLILIETHNLCKLFAFL